jgi:hypothetical protein
MYTQHYVPLKIIDTNKILFSACEIQSWMLLLSWLLLLWLLQPLLWLLTPVVAG